MKLQKSNELKVCSEVGSNVPIVLGHCPQCGLGNRTMILIDYVPNGYQPEHSTLYFKCINCSTITQKKIIEVAI